MSTRELSINPTSTASLPAATIAFTSAGAFLILLTLLHLLKPDLDPSWRFISEYAIGQYGWLMVVAFLAVATSFAMLFVAIRPHCRTIVGRIGLTMLLISAVSLVVAAIFPTDPITTPFDQATTNGTIHNIAGMFGFAMTFSMIFVSWRLLRNPQWTAARFAVWLAMIVGIGGFILSFGSLMVYTTQENVVFGPDVPVGWPTRIEIVTIALWLMTISWQAKKIEDKHGSR